jgi:hypothetical protein
MALSGQKCFLVVTFGIMVVLCLALIIIYIMSNRYEPWRGSEAVLIAELVLVGILAFIPFTVFVAFFVAICCLWCCGRREEPKREELEECYGLYGYRIKGGSKEVGDDWEKAIDGELKRVWKKFGKEYRREKSKARVETVVGR